MMPSIRPGHLLMLHLLLSDSSDPAPRPDPVRFPFHVRRYPFLSAIPSCPIVRDRGLGYPSPTLANLKTAH